MKNILILFLIGLFIIYINLSIKIYNIYDAWLGVIMGGLGIIGILSLLYVYIKSIIKNNKEKWTHDVEKKKVVLAVVRI